ncbi:MAG: HAMP domain-containing histidine kinase [Saprospiraceae bacterium]|nr:HAMP domain-containing histidine kinase [Saprospiraceae bacterium]
MDKLAFKRFGHWYYLWAIGLLMVAIGKLYERNYQLLQHDLGHQYKSQIESKIHETEELSGYLTKLLKSVQWSSDQSNQIYERISLLLKDKKQYENSHLVFCKGGNLLYWHRTESYFDPQWCPCLTESGDGLFTIHNENYYGVRQNISFPNFELCFILYSKLPNPLTSIKDSPYITLERSNKNQLPIFNLQKKQIGFVNHIGIGLSKEFSETIILFYILLLLVFYYPVHKFAKLFFERKWISWGFLSIFMGIVTTSSLAHWLVQDPEYFNSIFTKFRIQSILFEYTLFELIVFSFIIFHLSYLYHRYFSLPEFDLTQKAFTRQLIPILNYVTILLALLFYVSFFKTIFVKSQIVFELQKTIFMPVENYLILLSLLLIIISVFLISHKLFQSTFSFRLKLRTRFLMYLCSVVFFLPFILYLKTEIHPVTFILGASIIVWLFDYFVEYKQASSMWLISWLLIISVITSGLVFHYQNIRKRKEKEQIANQSIQQIVQRNDSLATSEIDLNQLISLSLDMGFDLFLFENKSLKYSSGFDSPDYQFCIRNLKKENSRIVRVQQSELWIHRFSKEHIVVLRHELPTLVKSISLFSYLFTILIILSYLISLLHQRYPILPEGLNIQVESKPSLRTKIQFYIILGIVFSFIIIAMVTVFFTRRSEQQISEESLFNKLRYLSTFLEQSIQNVKEQEDAKFLLREQIKTTSSLFDYSLEFYDNQGYQVPVFANPAASDSKIKLCNPEFYFFYPFSISDIIIKRISLPDHEEKLYAYKNIFFNSIRLGTIEMSSFHGSESSTENRLTNLINTLLNIYVFLFLIAASLATLLANSITSPLEVLSEKIKSMRLGKRNDTLEWESQDEIGDLIQDYNRMVSQIDESAELLAKSERDNAWREMAKQVAHEIKNPLTPMKLNIQYLLQRIKSGDRDIGEMAQKVSHSILEQIDGLTQIATEFSNFAKMPQGVHEKILLNELISHVHDLYRKRDDLDIFLTVPIDECYVFCDKNQLMRVLNNLINNAIQSIPEHRRGKIEIVLLCDPPSALIKIKDNGIGIPIDMKDKVFLPNFTTKSSGTGLGLAMCRQIVESVNGAIYFETQETVGTEFFVSLPIMKNEGQD